MGRKVRLRSGRGGALLGEAEERAGQGGTEGEADVIGVSEGNGEEREVQMIRVSIEYLAGG